MKAHTAILDTIQDSLSASLGEIPPLQWLADLPGGDINKAARIRCGNTDWFLKYHRHAPTGMFAAEALALDEISSHACIRVPSPIAHGNAGDTSWLVLEYLQLTSAGSAASLGEQLAAMHNISADRYGWKHNNFIGTTPQSNTCCESWSMFWRDHRIRPQLKLAQAGGHGARLLNKGERLLELMDQLMDGHKPAASLLHGDLWAGNKAYTHDGQAVIFDPASYYGDRETDIAMTRLFGGFEPAFYAAYEARHAPSDGYRVREDLYNLYHILNHLNLFGPGYLARCETMIDGLLAQVR